MKTFEQFLTEADNNSDLRRDKNAKIADTVSRIYDHNLKKYIFNQIQTTGKVDENALCEYIKILWLKEAFDPSQQNQNPQVQPSGQNQNPKKDVNDIEKRGSELDIIAVYKNRIRDLRRVSPDLCSAFETYVNKQRAGISVADKLAKAWNVVSNEAKLTLEEMNEGPIHFVGIVFRNILDVVLNQAPRGGLRLLRLAGPQYEKFIFEFVINPDNYDKVRALDKRIDSQEELVNFINSLRRR